MPVHDKKASVKTIQEEGGSSKKFFKKLKNKKVREGEIPFQTLEVLID